MTMTYAIARRKELKIGLPVIVGAIDVLLSFPILFLQQAPELHTPYGTIYFIFNFPAVLVSEQCLDYYHIMFAGWLSMQQIYAVHSIVTMIFFAFVIGYIVDFIRSCKNTYS